MSRRSLGLSAVVLAVLLTAGCGANYAWRPSVPEEMRTVCVPTFANESDVSELGALATRQILREVQREGTFRVRSAGKAALEVQGVVKRAGLASAAYDRRSGLRLSAYDFTAEVEVSVIDKTAGRVLVDNRRYLARTVLTAGQDHTTAQRDASGRLMDDLAQQVVRDLASLDFKR